MSRQFFVPNPPPGFVITGAYDPVLVLASFVVAVLATFMALRFTAKFLHDEHSSGVWRSPWLINSSVILGSGVWSMHFIAMLGFVLPMPMTYDLGITLVSLAVAISGCYLSFAVLAMGTLNTPKRIFSSVLLAVGIATMHYLGMEGMGMGNSLQYNPGAFAFSIVFGVVASYLALWLMVHFSGPVHQGSWVTRLLISMVMAASIAGIHYAGMAAAVFPHAPRIPCGPTRKNPPRQQCSCCSYLPVNHCACWF